jgi:hypothetical protein
MSEGFLGRWSKRKADDREGRPVEPEPALVQDDAAQPAATAVPDPGQSRVVPDDAGTPSATAPAAAAEPPPTLEDVAQLTPESDFRRFVAADVPPDVKNAAVKKLFADPHFNAMDGLDSHIDDYSNPEPLPPAMLKKLAGAKFLGMFDDEAPVPAASQQVAAASDAAPPEAAGKTEPSNADPSPEDPT